MTETWNSPEVVEEVSACFLDYERALMERDLAGMASWFEPLPSLVRFGIADRQCGIEELEAWRAAQPAIPPGRTLYETVVSTFGDGYAVVTTLFSYPGREVEGRQSQVWCRGSHGWRIVHAHVSEVSL